MKIVIIFTLFLIGSSLAIDQIESSPSAQKGLAVLKKGFSNLKNYVNKNGPIVYNNVKDIVVDKTSVAVKKGIEMGKAALMKLLKAKVGQITRETATMDEQTKLHVMASTIFQADDVPGLEAAFGNSTDVHPLQPFQVDSLTGNQAVSMKDLPEIIERLRPVIKSELELVRSGQETKADSLKRINGVFYEAWYLILLYSDGSDLGLKVGVTNCQSSHPNCNSLGLMADIK